MPPKRLRSDTSYQTPGDYLQQNLLSAPANLSTEFLSLLPAPTQQYLLLTAIKTHPDIYRLALVEQTKEVAKHSSIKENFDFISKSVWRQINIEHSRCKDSQLYRVAHEVASSVRSTVNDGILAKVRAESSYETKRSALETLRKIAKSCSLCELNYIDKAVTEEDMVEIFVEGMERVAGYMLDDEKERFLRENGDWVEKCEELWGFWKLNEETKDMKLDLRLSLFPFLTGEDDDEDEDDDA
ncbi:hypothetical protein BDD12DRAFT_855301 [Trichophaea hybrida]|nr:hypothetical protein BDD12DRAFT_855301 [Trichophaea hybrida]